MFLCALHGKRSVLYAMKLFSMLYVIGVFQFCRWSINETSEQTGWAYGLSKYCQTITNRMHQAVFEEQKANQAWWLLALVWELYWLKWWRRFGRVAETSTQVHPCWWRKSLATCALSVSVAYPSQSGNELQNINHTISKITQ